MSAEIGHAENALVIPDDATGEYDCTQLRDSNGNAYGKTFRATAIRVTKNGVDEEFAVMRVKLVNSNEFVDIPMRINHNEGFAVQVVDMDNSTGRGILILSSL